MRRPPRDVTVDEDEDTSAGQSSPVLVSLNFIVASLRRRWRFCAAWALAGLIAAIAFLVVVPPPHTAKASILLAHAAGSDPDLALATDVGLLMTRVVSTQTVSQLGLAMTPEDFLETVEPERVSSELITITLEAPTDAEAVRRLTALTSIYLDFRAAQLTRQSDVLIQGMQERITKLESDIAELTARISRLSVTTRGSVSSELNDLIEQRASLASKIETLQQSIEDATLGNNSVVLASRIIDQAAADTGGVKRRAVLALASGFLAALGLASGIVLFQAVTSDRLHRRSDISAAIGTDVSISVRRTAPLRKQLLWLPFLNAIDQRRKAERSRLAAAIVGELQAEGEPVRLAVGCVENAQEVRFAVADAATLLAADGSTVAVIDLSHHGVLDGRLLRQITASPGEPTVLRPLGVPQLARDTSDLQVAGVWDGEGRTWSERADVTLIIADLDPVVGADYLAAWSDQVMLAVTAGRSGAERLRSVAELVRAAGLEMRSAALLRTERTDDSLGITENDITAIEWPDVAPLEHSQPEHVITARSEVR